MAAQAGRNMLLKLDAAGTGAYVTVAGLRSRRLTFNASPVDITDSDSAGRWRELLGGSGMRNATLSGSGIFKDQSSDAAVRSAFFSGDALPWQVVIPDFGTVDGRFAITRLDYGGSHEGEVTFEITLESAGELQFEALP